MDSELVKEMAVCRCGLIQNIILHMTAGTEEIYKYPLLEYEVLGISEIRNAEYRTATFCVYACGHVGHSDSPRVCSPVYVRSSFR